MKKVTKFKTYSFLLINRIKLIEGILINQNDVFTTIINNPTDYQIDGIKFINNTKIKEIQLNTQELKEKVINSKFQSFSKKVDEYMKNKHINFEDLFIKLKSDNVFCELSLSKKNSIYVGKVINVYNDSIDINLYNINFELLDNAYIKFKDITSINILTDYSETFNDVISNNLL